MTAIGGPALVGALTCSLVFFANVAAGAAGMGAFLGDVAEMLTLFAAAVLFVVGVLAREAAAAAIANDKPTGGETSGRTQGETP